MLVEADVRVVLFQVTVIPIIIKTNRFQTSAGICHPAEAFLKLLLRIFN